MNWNFLRPFVKSIADNGLSKSTFDENDPIYEQINNLNPAYRKQLEPYLSYTYQPGVWDRIGNNLGFNTAEDKYRMEQQDRARLALAGLQNDAFQNSYNSAQSQAARERQAGLNPDLAGEASGEPAAQLEQPLDTIDPEIFRQPVELPDLVNLFGTAISSLTSVGTFKKLVADIGLIGANKSAVEAATVGTELSNFSEAYELAGEYLGAFDPDLLRQYPDSDFSQEFFSSTVVPDKLKKVASAYPSLSGKSRQLFEQAVQARKDDPRVYDKFYQGKSSATTNRADAIAKSRVYGDLSAVDEVVRTQNKMLYFYKEKALKLEESARALLADFNNQKLKNDFDLEAWKFAHGVPEKVGEAQVAQYITDKARQEMELLKLGVSRDFLKAVQDIQKKNPNDMFVQYLAESMILGSFAPLQSQSASGGILGANVSRSWQRPYVPATPSLEETIRDLMRKPQGGSR